MAYLHTARLNDQLMRLGQVVRDIQESSETLDESLIELMTQIREMARDIVLKFAEIERELALISTFRALENLRNLVREAGE